MAGMKSPKNLKIFYLMTRNVEIFYDKVKCTHRNPLAVARVLQTMSNIPHGKSVHIVWLALKVKVVKMR